MNKEERKKFSEWAYLIWREYPYPEPCINCYYWTGCKPGHRKNAGIIMPHCDYLDIEGEPRGTLPDLDEKKCDKFRSDAEPKPKKPKKEIFYKDLY